MSIFRRWGVTSPPAHRKHAVACRVSSGRQTLAALSATICVALVALPLVDPGGLSTAYTGGETSAVDPENTQTVQVLATADVVAARENFEVSVTPTRTASHPAPAAGTPDPDSAQGVAFEMLTNYGWDQAQFDCLVALWSRESGWNVYAHNASSGAYGIPQALPGEKMASAGSDWATNPATQISWGLGYISGRYGTPCGAWESATSRGWY